MKLTDSPFTFYVGTNNPSWLWGKPSQHPLFISVRRINKYKKLKKTNVSWCLDSGGFTELTMFNEWRTTPSEYVDSLQRIVSDIGGLVWASPQDWMCEPHMIKNTGKSINEHQHLTCQNFCEIQQLNPPARVIPVLQGWNPDDYITHFDMYKTYGINLVEYETVGMGSFCRRASVAGVKELVQELSGRGVKMHGFGLKKDGISLFGEHLQSSDSMAWSMTGRIAGWRNEYLCGRTDHKAKSCGDCHTWAMMWADKIIENAREKV